MPDPMYRRIAEELRAEIESGDLPPGSQLPTELELRERYEASRNTVRDAMKSLITRGLIETRPGQGTFVIEKIEPYITVLTGERYESAIEADVYVQVGPEPSDKADNYTKEVAASLREPRSTEPRVEIRTADEVAEDLQVQPDTQVVIRQQKRFIDGIPFSLQTSFYPMSLVEQGALRLIQAPDISEGTVTYIRNQLDLSQVGYRDKIKVRAPDPGETTFFKLPDDGRVAVFEVRRTAFDQKGSPMRLTISIYPADRNQFTVTVGEVPDEIPTGPDGTSELVQADKSAAPTA
jgi:GntR family transcriptional regulator